MGFLGDLGKGFIRSAVNQVGRDTGKVVSNSIYGDAHSTPIRNVNMTTKGNYIDDEGCLIDPSELRARAENDGWKPKYSSHSTSYKWFSRIFCFFVWLLFGIIYYPYSLMFPIVPLIIIIAGIVKIFSKKVTWERDGLIYVQKNDRRYKGGYRIESINGKETVKLPCNETDKRILLIHGISDFIIAGVLCLGASHWGEKLERTNKIDEYQKFLQDSAKTMENIEFWNGRDSAIYNRRIEEFNKKYQEAIEYIKNNDSIKNYQQ